MGSIGLNRNSAKRYFKLDWRLAWYSALLWSLLVFVASLAVFPWFYLAVPAVVLLATSLFFRGTRRAIFAKSLRLSVFWFFTVLALDFVIFVGFDLSNLYLYLVDGRSFLKFPIVILVPVLWGLLKEQKARKRKRANLRPIFGRLPL